MDLLIEICRTTFVAMIGLAGCVGVMALVIPQAFTSIASAGNSNIMGGVNPAGRKYDIDRFVLAHQRLFGIVVVFTVGCLWLVSSYGPESYSKASLLIVVSVALVTGIIATSHIIRQSREIEDRLAEAHSDPLTGLTNRRAFERELTRRLTQRQCQGTPVCLIILDIDEFKNFNDQHGHLVGDLILTHVADAMRVTARPDDLVVRLGGDEFVVLLPNTGLFEACDVAEEQRIAINQNALNHEGDELQVEVSLGLAEAESDDSTDSLLKRAASALYAAKKAGKNCCFRQGGPEPVIVDQFTCV